MKLWWEEGMRLVKFLRQTYSGDEFLIVENNVYKRLKVVKKEAVGEAREDLMDFLTKLSRLKHPAIAPIEGSDFRSELPQVLFAYYGGEPVEMKKTKDAQEFATFLLALLRELVHHGIVIPVVSFQDFLRRDNDYFMLAPCWRNYKQIPQEEGIFVAPEFANHGVTSVASTAYVFGKMILSFSQDETVRELVGQFVHEDPTKRRLHFVVSSSLVGSFGRIRIRPIILARREEEEVLSFVKNLAPKLNTILVYGPQRSGKTTLLSSLVDQFRHLGVPTVWLTDVDALVTDLIQLLDEEAYRSLDDVTKDRVSKFLSSQGLSSDEVMLTVAKLLNRMRTLVLVADDAHELTASMKTLLRQLNEYVYPHGHVLLLASVDKDIDFNLDLKIEVGPLNFEETTKLISQSLGIDEEKLSQEFLRWLHAVTHGLAGKIIEVLKILAKENKLGVSEGRLQVDETFLESDMSGLLELSLEKYMSSNEALLSLCGEKFSPEEVQILCEALDLNGEELKDSLRTLMKDGLIYYENERFRFTLPEIWRSFYDSVSPSIRNETHTILALKTAGREKRAWHLRMLGKTTSAAAMYLLAARREISSYGDISAALDYLAHAQQLMRDRESYALVSLKFKALSIKGQSNSLKLFAKGLEKKERFAFFRYAALVVAGEIREAFELEKKIDFSGRTPYSELSRLIYRAGRILLSGERVDQNLIKKLSLLVSNLLDLPLHKKLKATTLNVLARTRGVESMRSLELLNTARSLAEEGPFYDVLADTLLLLGTRLTATPEAQRLFAQVVEIANKIGSQSLLMTALSNTIWTNLYRGEIEKMFTAMYQLREFARMVSNSATEAYTYFVEAQYHTYNKQLQEALEDLEKERSIEKSLGIEERGLRATVAAHAICGNIDEARRILNENIDNPALNNPNFVDFRDLILAENDEDLLKAWKKFLSKDHLYWMEETCQVFGARIALLDRDSFFSFAERLEKVAIKSGAFLSLAQVLESLALAYKALGEDLLAMNYAERAITIYRTHGFDAAADWLEEKLGVVSEMGKLVRLFETDLGEEGSVKVSLKDLRSLVKSFVDAYAVTQYALDTLKVTDIQDDLKSILDFLLSRTMNVLPINSAALMLIDGSGRVVELSQFNVKEVPKDPVASYEPFEVFHTVQIGHNYRLSIYLANKSLYLSRMQGENLMRIILNLQEVATHILKNALSYRRSITDPLTGLYTRWYFLQRLREEFERVKRYGGNFSVVMADIDDFKKVNDTYGHRIGDEVLKFIASIMRSYTRTTDIVGRYGGEEFILILPNTDKESAALVCQKILHGMIAMNPFDFRVTMSFGVAGYPEDEVLEPDDLVGLADKAMYTSKERGKACVTIHR
ncbi:diguanylate cyclase [Pseudothermotoga sp.]